MMHAYCAIINMQILSVFMVDKSWVRSSLMNKVMY